MKAEINGINIDYRDQGSGTPVVLIHAFPLNQTMWDDQITAIRSICRTVTLDVRGFGGSDTNPPHTIDQMAADINGLMSLLSIEEAVLVGLSMGGYISFAFYRNYPGSVRALVLADTRASADTHAARTRRHESASLVEKDGVKAIAEDTIKMLLADSTIQNRPDVVTRVRSMIEGNTSEGVAAAQRAMAARQDSTYILPGIVCPTLVIVGSEDKLTPVNEAEAIRNGLRGSKLQVIPGAGHLSNIERPDEFNAHLIEFIKSV